jgi:hypothetical protein
MNAPEPARPSHTLASAEAAVSGDVVEIRPTEILRVCPECLVSNTSADTFCTACGTELPAAADTDLLPEPDVPLDRTAFMAPEREIDPPLNLSTEERSPAARRSERLLHGWHLAVAGFLLALTLAGLATFAALWQAESNHASTLLRSLSDTRAELASTKATLHATQAQLAETASLSDKRRAVLLQAADVVGKVDPLLSAVDNIQGKAENLSAQGSVLTADADSFISTVSDLVNYLIRTSSDYVDYSWVEQQIDSANSQLNTLRYDESAFSSGDAGYSDASKSFGVKADAFSASVRALQKQLKAVSSK